MRGTIQHKLFSEGRSLTATPLVEINGIRIGTTNARVKQQLGVSQKDREDLVLMEIADGANTAAVFTRNAFCAAPVQVARSHIEVASPRFLIINSGNANAGTGKKGLVDAKACCEAVARHTHCPLEAILPFSTGVIGEPLPVDRIREGIVGVVENLSPDGWEQAARAIMTTDTAPKGISRRIETLDGPFTITGISKGSGMIRPDMATMLAFIATDASVAPDVLRHALTHAVNYSFHRITVDGDTSTNDACVLTATGITNIPTINHIEGDLYEAFQQGITEVCQALAKTIIEDAEGANKFITVQVQGGASEDECAQVAFTVAHSPLVKTAFFAEDPNWGRILAAVGRAGLSDFDITKVRIFMDDVCIVASGARAEGYTEADGQRVMEAPEITIRIELGRGFESTEVWTCDLSYEYVRINAEYRT
uniref:Arginine biosynthesis bifunctional protein ArgJ n=1 Tax=Candidatus Kentrum sp. TUN TaxID=2126343 RepID=A0A450ZJ74_9GAMM|nr:MAG: glutamate N-acetyltransferase [Candidatus Kentron sp. TUN]VFK55322.1 MAG: glutamate N-acetyltransferase [Candidatus Kentron sp. TUN]VFK57125.1 MAG: glutamate N-acetyltransferase [Candidatus Kentron sp. TUN]